MKHDFDAPVEIVAEIVDRDPLRGSVKLKVQGVPSFWVQNHMVSVQEPGKSFMIPYSIAFKNGVI